MSMDNDMKNELKHLLIDYLRIVIDKYFYLIECDRLDKTHIIRISRRDNKDMIIVSIKLDKFLYFADSKDNYINYSEYIINYNSFKLKDAIGDENMTRIENIAYRLVAKK